MPRTIVSHGIPTRYMKLHDSGGVEREPHRKKGPSSTWKIVGAVTRNNFGHVTREYTLQEILDNAGEIPWRHGNGSQKTYLVDEDHGTRREWRLPTHEVF